MLAAAGECKTMEEGCRAVECEREMIIVDVIIAMTSSCEVFESDQSSLRSC